MWHLCGKVISCQARKAHLKLHKFEIYFGANEPLTSFEQKPISASLTTHALPQNIFCWILSV